MQGISGHGSAATHLLGLLFPSLLLGKELQVELLLLLLIIFLQLKEEEGQILGAASSGAARCKPSPAWPRLPQAGHKCSTNMARQRERSDLFSVSLSVCWGYGEHDVSVLHPAPQEF